MSSTGQPIFPPGLTEYAIVSVPPYLEVAAGVEVVVEVIVGVEVGLDVVDVVEVIAGDDDVVEEGAGDDVPELQPTAITRTNDRNISRTKDFFISTSLVVNVLAITWNLRLRGFNYFFIKPTSSIVFCRRINYRVSGDQKKVK
jgi:hypothetical protein